MSEHEIVPGEDRDQEIADLYNSGMTPAEIARKIGWTANRVGRRVQSCRKCGMVEVRSARYQAEMRNAEIEIYLAAKKSDEERYAALALLAARVGRPWHDPDLVPLLEHLVVTGAWWDLVDETAGRHVAPTHRAHPEAMAAVLRDWSVHDDLWLRLFVFDLRQRRA